MPDEPQRFRGDGRAPAPGGLRGGHWLRGRRAHRHQHLCDPRGRRAEGHRPSGPAEPTQGREPRVAGRADRLLGPGAGSCRPAPPLSSGRRVPAAGRGARARRPARPGLGAGADRRGRGDNDGRADGRRRRGRPRGHPGAGSGGGDGRAVLGDQRLAPDHLRLRQDLHVLHRAVQPRPGAEPSVRRDRRRGASARREPATAR